MGEQTENMSEKKSNTWIWAILAIVLIAIVVGLYFWLSGDNSGAETATNAGNSIPRPPALPSG